MGASKTYQYNDEVIDMASVGRAVSHPARMEIVDILKAFGITRSLDLALYLQLSHSTVHEHILKMREGGIVHLTYEYHGYLITLIPERLDQFASYISRR